MTYLLRQIIIRIHSSVHESYMKNNYSLHNNIQTQTYTHIRDTLYIYLRK